MASPLLPPNAKHAPLSRSRMRGARAASLEGAIRLGQFAESISAPFVGRQGLTRAKLLRREGGTARSEKSVEDGLDWIVRHQRADGSWSLNFHDQCQAAPCPLQLARTAVGHRRHRAWPCCRSWARAIFTRSNAATRSPSGADWNG